MNAKLSLLYTFLYVAVAGFYNPLWSQVSCGANENRYVVEIDASSETYLSEVAWSLVDPSGAIIDTSAPGTYTSNTIYRDTVCLTNGVSYTFRAYDSYGDGWQGSTYKVFRVCDQSVLADNGGNSPDNGVTQSNDLEVSEAVSATACPSCHTPSNLTAGNLTTSSADLGWTEMGSASLWDLEWGAKGFTQGGGTMLNGLTAKPHNLSGLSAFTSYEFYVRADCGGGSYSSWSGPYEFRTLAAPLSLPYTNDFEGSLGNFNNEAANKDNWVINSTLMSSGSNSAYNGYSSNANNILLLPNPIDLNTYTNAVLTFDQIAKTEGDWDFARVEYSSDNGSTWQAIPAGNYLGSSADYSSEVAFHEDSYSDWGTSSTTPTNSWWKTESFNLAGLSSGAIMIRFRLTSDGSAQRDGWYIDNLSITNPSCPSPSALMANNITAQSADLGWTENGSAGHWDLEWGANGFSPGSGNMINSATSNPYSLSGLISNTTYDFYVRANCAAGGGSGQSNWAGPYTFTTTFGISCSSGTQYTIFEEDFDVNNGWTGDISGSTTNGMWVFPASGAPSSGNGPSGAHSGSNYMYVETSGSGQPYTANAISPLIDLSAGLNTAALTFYYHAYGSDVGTLDVGVSSSSSGPWTSTLNIAGETQTSASAPYKLQSANLDAYLGQQIYIRFNYISGNSFSGDVAVDLMKVYTCLTCPSPSALTSSNITSSSVDISWTSGGASDAEVEWGSSGFITGNGTRMSTTGNSYTISGLTPNTTYDIYVRDSCSASDISPWVGPETITTLCAGSMNGTYTINAALPTAGTNFNSFADAESELNSCGISGPVTINISAGNYSDQLHLKNVAGVSLTNTITFNGSGSDTLTWDGNGPQATVIIEGTKHVSLNGMTIENLASSEAWGVLLTDNSDSATINNCIILMDSTTSSTDVSAVLISESYINDLDEGADVDYLTLSNSTLIGGYYAMNLEGVSTGNPSYGHVIDNNTFRQFNIAGIYLDELQDITITNNTLTSDRGSVDGIYSFDLNDYKIEGNYISVTDYGLYITDGNDGFAPATRSRVVNNMVISTADYAIYLNDFEATDVFHNSTKGEPAMAINDQVDVDVRNNIFTTDGDFAFESFDPLNASDVIDYNLYYKSGAGNAFEIGPSAYADLSAWQVADGSRNVNSLEGNPVFLAPDDLHCSGQLANNVGSNLGVTQDIDGDTRSTNNPDIGADEYTPPSCPNPYNLSASNISSTSADISWTAGWAETLWNIEYGTTGFSPGSGTVITGVNSNPYTISGLVAITEYDVYIQADCGGGDLSIWFGPFTFRTDFRTAQALSCGSAVPVTLFTEEFEAVNGWTGDINSGNDSWEIPGHPTSSSTGPNNEHSGPAGSFMNFEASNSSVSSGAIVSPPIDLTSATIDAELSFWMHAYGADMGTLTVGIGNSQSGPFTDVFTWSGELQTSANDPWQNIGVDISTYTGQVIYLQFHQLDDGNSFTGDMSIDLVEITACVTCPLPTALSAQNINDNSADLSWTAGSTESSWEISYGESGISPTDGSRLITANPYTLTGLMPGTDYDYYVRAICAVGDSSIWAGPFTFSTPCSTPLSGTYTINASLPTAGNNYSSFAHASNALNACGITDAVVFNVAPGNYVDHLHIINVSGASMTNSITINGSGADTLTWDQTGPQATVLIDGTPYVTINNLRIVNNASSEAWGILLTNNADHAVINGNTIIMDTNSSSSDVSAIIVSGSYINDLDEGGDVDNLTVSNNEIYGGYYAMNFEGNSTGNPSSAYVISGNTIEDFWLAGLYIDEIQDLSISANVLETERSTSSDGIYLTDVNDYQVDGNYVYIADYGIYISDGNDGFAPANRSRVVNNMVFSTDDYGLYLNDFEATDVFNNTILGEPAIRLNDQVDADIRNNIFASDGDYVFESTDALNPTDVIDYNLYFKHSSGDAFDIGVDTYSDLAAWQAGDASRNLNSVEGDPLFAGLPDLHVYGLLANDAGTPLASVTTDFDGESRSATNPDIGADEYDVAQNDAMARDVILHRAACPSLTDTVWLSVYNRGVNTITSLPLTIMVSGDTTATIMDTIAVNIPAFSSDTILAGTFNSRSGGAYTVTVYTQLPSDEDNANDTASSELNRFRVVPTITDVSCFGGSDGMVTVKLENPNGLTKTLMSSLNSNNGAGANMFDINILKPSLEITGFDVNLDPGNYTVEVFYKNGSYNTDMNNASAWTSAGQVNVSSAGTDVATPVMLPGKLTLNSGVHGLFIGVTSGNGWNYYDGNSLGSLEAANSDLEIYEGVGRASTNFSSADYSPRVFSGSIIYNGKAPDYVWSNGDTTATADSLMAGTYTLTTTDGEGCVSTITVNVGEPSPLSINKTVSQASCLGNNDGAIQIVASGGTPPYRYIWNGDTTFTADTSSLYVGQYFLSVIDANNCLLNDTSQIVVLDTIAPVLNLQSYTTYLDANGLASIDSSDVDNGSTDDCGITSIDLSQSNFSCNDAGTNTITVTVNDINGNSQVGTADVTIMDTISPIAITQPFTTYLDVNGNAAISPADVNNGSNDVCGINSLSLDNQNFDCSDIGINQVVLTVTDNNGNISSDAAIVTVADTIRPIVSLLNPTVYLNANGTFTLTSQDVDNGSSDACGIASISLGKTSFDCTDIGINNVLVTVSDNNGNSRNATSLVTVMDTISPSVITTNYTAYLNATGNVTINASDVDGGSSDACGIGSINVTPNSFSCAAVGANTVTLEITDNNGNFHSANAIVTVVDTISPVVSLKNLSVYLNAAGSISIIPSDVENGSNDACGIGSINLDKSNFNCADVGINTITATVTDLNGNVKTGTTTVTVMDSIKPTAMAKDIDLYLNGNGQAFLSASDIDNGSNDACGIATSNVDIQSFDCADVGSNKVVLTVTDNNSNLDTAWAYVQVIDTISPTITTKNHTLYLDANGTASIEVLDVSSGTSNACSIDTVTIDKTTFNCSDVGQNTVTITAVASGGTASNQATAIVTVMDTISPLALTTTYTIYLDANGMASIIPSDVDGGSSDNCGVATLNVDKNMFSCADLGNNTVKLTVTDVNGNSSTSAATVIVRDIIPPVAVSRDLTVYLDANGSASVAATQVNNGSTDNCSFTPSLSQSVYGCSDVGLNQRYLIITDMDGNKDSTDFLITVRDTISPVLVLRNINIQLGSNGQASIAPIQLDSSSSDNCSNQLFFTASKSSFNCNNLGPNNVRVTATDIHGNTSTAIAVVTVEDNINPVLSVQNVTLSLDANGQAGLNTAMVNNGSSDNCGITNMTLSQTIFDCSDLGQNNIQFMAMDGSGNTSTTGVVVTVVDNISPTVLTQNITAYLNASGQITISASDINNGSTDNCSIQNMSLDVSTFDCSDIGPNSITLSVTDGSGNTTAASAIVTIVDTISPYVIAQNINVPLDASGNATITAADVNNGSTDACGISSIAVSRTTFSCADLGANNVTLSVTDNQGNTSTSSAIVTVVDNIAPTVITQNYTASLDANGTATITTADIDNGSSDNCTLAAMSLDVSSFNCSALGANTVTLTVTDNSGNSASKTAVVTVVDNIAPTVLSQNITVQLNSSGQASIVPADINNGSNDNCGISSYSLDKSNFSCADIGSNTVSLTAIDQSGNSSSTTAVVTVVDNTKPVVIAQNYTLALDANGNGVISASDVDNGSNDACGISTMSVLPNSFSCSDLGANSVTLTVTDNNGNVSTATATVTVIDQLAPVVNTQNATIYLDASGSANITTADIDNGSLDNCGISTSVLSKTSFDCSNLGQNLISLSLTDNSGNSSSATASVTVIDTVSPSFNNLPGTITAYANSSQCGASVNWSTLQASDNCGLVNISTSQSSGGYFSVGSTTITATATDPSGNSTSGSFTVVVIDTISPVFSSVPSNMVINPNTASCDAIVTWSAPAATDNCGTPSLSSSHASGSTFPVGTTTVTYTATDMYGNSTQYTFQVVVIDQIAPTINNVPANINVSADPGACSAVVSYSSPGVTDNCSGSTIVSSHASGTAFPLGTTTVTFTATDGAGNVSTANFSVNVTDDEAPTVLSVPPSDTIGACNAAYTYSLPTASDNCGPVSVVQTAGLSSGNVFPAGITQNTFRISDGSGNDTVVSFTVVVIPQEQPQLPSLLEICANSPAVDIVMGQSGMQWSGNGVINGNTFDPAQAGAGRHILSYNYTDDYGCVSSGSISVTVLSIPAEPVIQRVGSTTLSTVSTFASYQWYRNGQLISGATNQTYSYVQGGNYQVVVTNNNGCENYGEGFIVGSGGSGIGLNEYKLSSLSVYPNPGNGLFTLDLQQEEEKNLELTVFSVEGKKVYEQKGRSNAVGKLSLDLTLLPDAAYFLYIQGDQEVVVKKLIIN